MAILYSVSISGFCKTINVFDAMKTVKKAGYDGLDFCLSTYSDNPGSSLRDEQWWRQWVLAVKTYSDALELPVFQAHAPWKISIPEDFTYSGPDAFYRTVFEACSILGCGKLVFHPVLWFHPITSPDISEKIYSYNLLWFRELLPLAEEYRITVDIENMFDFYHVQKGRTEAFPFTAAEQLLRLVRDLNSPYVRVCLDTGHANIAGQNIPGMIRSFGDKLDVLHLNDNFGAGGASGEDLHLLPGRGDINWSEVKCALRDISYSGVYNFEIIDNLSLLGQEEISCSLASAKEMFL